MDQRLRVLPGALHDVGEVRLHLVHLVRGQRADDDAGRAAVADIRRGDRQICGADVEDAGHVGGGGGRTIGAFDGRDADVDRRTAGKHAFARGEADAAAEARGGNRAAAEADLVRDDAERAGAASGGARRAGIAELDVVVGLDGDRTALQRVERRRVERDRLEPVGAVIEADKALRAQRELVAL